jgi:prepilin peptidase CpaA
MGMEFNVLHGVVIVLGLIVLVTDSIWKKIFNVVTFPAMLLGLVLNTCFWGVEGLKFSLIGLLVGGFLMFLPFVLRYAMAGDLKYLAAVGALLGPAFALFTLLMGSIIHGVISVIYLLWTRKMRAVGGNLWFWVKCSALTGRPADFKTSTVGFLPYGAGLALGSFLMVWMTQAWSAGLHF